MVCGASDVTTKDVVRGGDELAANLPCTPGLRSPCNLITSWYVALALAS
jgi:hypothetical protein